MKNEPIIRYAQPKDVEQLVLLCKAHAEYEKADYHIGNKKTLLTEHLFAKEPILKCLVVAIDDKLLGYATYIKQYSTWDAAFYLYMDCLFLNDDSRGYGLGEKLIDQIKIEAKNMECDHIQWHTPDFNVRAIKFYKRIGAYSKTKERFFLGV